MERPVRISTHSMPYGLRDRGDKILTQVCDNYQSYNFDSDTLRKIRSLRERFFWGSVLNESEFRTLHEVFRNYYKEPERANALAKWWNGEVAKIVFSELGD